VRVLRLVRIFRVFKISKYSQNLKVCWVLNKTYKFQVIVATVKRSKDGLIMLTFLVLLVMILFSSFMYFAEQSESTFDSKLSLWIRKDGNVR
jgi:hypothetical protein